MTQPLRLRAAPRALFLLLSMVESLFPGFAEASRVFPNPWNSKNSPGYVTFDGLQPRSEVKIFTVSSRWVRTLEASSGAARWDLKNENKESVASGYYLFVLTNAEGKEEHGKLAVIR